MAKARGNKLVPPANYSRNPMGAPLSQGPVQPFVNQTNNDLEGYIQYAESYGQVPLFSGTSDGRSYRNLAGVPPVSGGRQKMAPRSFNPANQDVLARAAAALNAVQQDRQNPMSYGRPMLPMSVASQPNRFVGPSAQQTAFNGPNTPAIRNPINQELAPVRDPQAAAMDALRARIDAMAQQSQQANPMAPPAPVYNPMQAEIDRGTRQGNIMMTPGAGSSLEATRNFRRIQPEDLNGITAGTVNGYNGNAEYARNPMRLDPEAKFNLAQANAQRVVGGGAAADPTNMRGRFGGAYGNNLNADATAIAEGRAVRTADGNVVYHTGTPESARAAQTAGKSVREALRDRSRPAATPEEAERRRLADERKAENAARHQAFKDANGGMNYGQYDRMQRQNALTMRAVDEGRLSPEAAMFRMQTRADKALRRAGNPMAMSVAKGGRLFPDLLAGKGGRAATQNQNPMSQTFSSMTKDSAPSADSLEAATSLAVATVNGITGPDGSVVRPPSAFAKQLKERGYSPEDDPGMALPNTHVYETIQSGNKLNPSDVRDLRNIAFSSRERTKNDTEWWGGKKAPFSNIGAGPFQKNPEYQKEVQDMYNSLADMPEDAPDAQYEKWAQDMEALVKRWRL